MVKISDIWYYGRSYSENIIWWFCRIDEQIYMTDELTKKYNFVDEAAIIETDRYIPLFKTDIELLEKEYIDGLYKDEKRDFEKIMQSERNASYDLVFKIFIERCNKYDWYEFEEQRMMNDAVKWCKENGIKYQM